MQENSKLKEYVKKYLEKRQKSSPTKLDVVLRSFLKGEFQTFCDKYPFLVGVSVNFAHDLGFVEPERTHGDHEKKINHEKDKMFLSLSFEKSNCFGEIIFFDSHIEYHILNDTLPESEDISKTLDYKEDTSPYKPVIEEVWGIVGESFKEEENAKKEFEKRQKIKYTRLYWLCYGIACLIAILIILLNRSENNSVSLWYLTIAIVPAILGSYFKYKTLDKK